MANNLSFSSLYTNKIENQLPNLDSYMGTEINTIKKIITPKSPTPQPTGGYNFGSEFIFQPTTPDNCFINNFVLKIKVSNLMNKIIPVGTQVTSFNFYTNSIALALIKSLELKIGTEVIISKKLHYDVFLDLLNEYDDPDKNEWSLFQKFESLSTIKQTYPGGVTNDLDLYIPLKFWCDRSINSAIPMFLLKNLANPITLTIESRNLEDLRIFNVHNIAAANYDPNTNPNIKEIELFYDEHNFGSAIREKLNGIYNSGNDYEIIFDSYYTQQDLAPTAPSNIPPPDSKFAENENVQIIMNSIDINEGPLKEVLFLFRNLERMESPSVQEAGGNHTKGETPIKNLPESEVARGDYYNYTILDTDSQPIDNFDKLTITKTQMNEDIIEDIDATYLKKVVSYQTKLNVPRKNIYTYSFETRGTNNFYSHAFDNPLKFTFKKVFYEYQVKTPAPALPYRYDVITMFRFLRKLNISSKGYVQLDNWQNTEVTEESKEITEQIEFISGLKISDVAKSILIYITNK